jgi:hypothetical protein
MMTDLSIQLKHAMQALAKDWHVKIPDGFSADSPGLGEPARTFLKRIANAHEPTWGQRLAWHALEDVGITENPPGSNSGPRINDALKFCGVPLTLPADQKSWCACMVSLWLHEMGYEGPWPTYKESVASWEAMAEKQNLFVPASMVRAGDLVTFQFDNNPGGDHIGIVTGQVNNGYVPTVEGNTSADDKGSQSNGGGVFARMRPVRLVNHFIRLKK